MQSPFENPELWRAGFINISTASKRNCGSDNHRSIIVKDLPRLIYALPSPGPWVSSRIKTKSSNTRPKLSMSEYPVWVDTIRSIHTSMLWNLSGLNLLLNHHHFHLPIANWKYSARQGLTEELISTSHLTQILFPTSRSETSFWNECVLGLIIDISLISCFGRASTVSLNCKTQVPLTFQPVPDWK